MKLRIPLSKEIEADLRQRAAAAGQDLESFVMRALHETLAAEQSTKTRAVQNGEGWAARLDSWIASHPVVSHLVDDSRESIYDGRGE